MKQVFVLRSLYAFLLIATAFNPIFPCDSAFGWTATRMRRESPLSIAAIGNNQDTTSATTVTYALAAAIPAGSMVVVVFGGRCLGTASMWSTSDSKSNTYSVAVGANTPTLAEAVVIFFSTLSTALASGDTITASCGSSANTATRTISVLKLSRPAVVDQIGTNAQAANTVQPTVTTSSSVTVNREVIIGGSSNNGSSSAYTEDTNFQTAYIDNTSLGAVDVAYTIRSNLSGTQAYAPTRSSLGSMAVNVIATFR